MLAVQAAAMEASAAPGRQDSPPVVSTARAEAVKGERMQAEKKPVMPLMMKRCQSSGGMSLAVSRHWPPRAPSIAPMHSMGMMMPPGTLPV